jgi:hypothetical protein
MALMLAEAMFITVLAVNPFGHGLQDALQGLPGRRRGDDQVVTWRCAIW